MKIGIITILKVNNYGSDLQAYALHQKLLNLGFDNEIIDYLYFKNRAYTSTSMSKPVVFVSRKDILKAKILSWIDRWSEVRYSNIYKKRIANFNLFHQQNTKLSKTFRSINELYSFKHAYDTFIVGSDQVWNPMTQSSIEPYFLTFAPNGKRKISYGSSFGVQHIKTEDKTIFSNLLNNLDIISCREKNGVNLIHELTGREAQHVLDPTLLLSRDEWNTVAKEPTIEDPYILIYELTNSSYISLLAIEIKKKTGYKVVRICKDVYPKESDQQILNIRDAGPAEFLGLFSKAKLVLTNSFHGSIFSIVYGKSFYTIFSPKKKNNSRQKDLLHLLGLECCLLQEGSPYPDKGFLPINYDHVYEKLKIEKEKSVQFLESTLKN